MTDDWTISELEDEMHRLIDRTARWEAAGWTLTGAALGAFIVFWFYLVWWMWWLGITATLGAVVCEWRRRHTRMEALDLFLYISTRPWWLGLGQPNHHDFTIDPDKLTGKGDQDE